MTTPIVAYGHPVLRTSCVPVDDHPEDIDPFINSLWETLERCGGVGLAAPQINSNHKAFIVNSELMFNELSDPERKVMFEGDKGIKETFINANILAVSEEQRTEPEACLSIPGICEPVARAWEIIIEYQDRSFTRHRKQFAGYTAKVIQHEYDHTRGILFIDYLTPLKKKVIRSRLRTIKDGKVRINYPMVFKK